MCRSCAENPPRGKRCPMTEEKLQLAYYNREQSRESMRLFANELQENYGLSPELARPLGDEGKPSDIAAHLADMRTYDPEAANRLEQQIIEQRGHVPGTHNEVIRDLRHNTDIDQAYKGRDPMRFANNMRAHADFKEAYLNSPAADNLTDEERARIERTIALQREAVEYKFHKYDDVMGKYHQAMVDIDKAQRARDIDKLRALEAEHQQTFKDAARMHEFLDRREPQDFELLTAAQREAEERVARDIFANTDISVISRKPTRQLKEDMKEHGLGEDTTAEEYFNAVIPGTRRKGREIYPGVKLKRTIVGGKYKYFYQVKDYDLKGSIDIEASPDDKITEIGDRIPNVDLMHFDKHEIKQGNRGTYERFLSDTSPEGKNIRHSIAQVFFRGHYNAGDRFPTKVDQNTVYKAVQSSLPNEPTWHENLTPVWSIAKRGGIDVETLPGPTRGHVESYRHIRKQVRLNDFYNNLSSHKQMVNDNPDGQRDDRPQRGSHHMSRSRKAVALDLVTGPKKERIKTVRRMTDKYKDAEISARTPKVKENSGGKVAKDHDLRNKTDVKNFIDMANDQQTIGGVEARSALDRALRQDLSDGYKGRPNTGRGNNPYVGVTNIPQDEVKKLIQRQSQTGKFVPVDKYHMVSDKVRPEKDPGGNQQCKVKVVTKNGVNVLPNAAVIGGNTPYYFADSKVDENGNVLEVTAVDYSIVNDEVYREKKENQK